MKIVISTHRGVLYNEEVLHIVVKNNDGEFAIYNNHIPIISMVTEGYIKLVDNQITLFVALVNGIVEFKNNIVTVLAQEAQVGEDYKKAMEYLDSLRKLRIEENKKKNIDYTAMEEDLKKNIKATKAGRL